MEMAHAANLNFCGNLSYVIQQDKMTWPNVTAKLKDKTGVTAATVLDNMENNISN